MRRSSGKGFSLAELLIASGILAAALVPLFLMQGTALMRVRASRSQVHANALANELAEQLRLVPFSSLPTAAPLEFRVLPGAGTPVELASGAPLALGRYPVESRVKLMVEPLSPPELLARLTITVAWTEDKVAREHKHVELLENRMGATDAP